MLVGVALLVVAVVLLAAPASERWTIREAERRTGLALREARSAGWATKAGDVFRATVHARATRAQVARLGPRWDRPDAATLRRLARTTTSERAVPPREAVRAARGDGWYALLEPETRRLRIELCAPLTAGEEAPCP
jgi:hypothetical protein